MDRVSSGKFSALVIRVDVEHSEEEFLFRERRWMKVSRIMTAMHSLLVRY
jgi:hypothetical protein